MHRAREDAATPQDRARATLHEGLKAARAMRLRQLDLPGTLEQARAMLDARGPHDPNGGLRQDYYLVLAYEQPVTDPPEAQQTAFQRLATRACKTAQTHDRTQDRTQDRTGITPL